MPRQMHSLEKFIFSQNIFFDRVDLWTYCSVKCEAYEGNLLILTIKCLDLQSVKVRYALTLTAHMTSPGLGF